MTQFNADFGAMMVDTNATHMRVRFVDVAGGVRDDAVYSTSVWPPAEPTSSPLVPALVGGIAGLVLLVGGVCWCRGRRARRLAVQKAEAQVSDFRGAS